jgi:cell division protein ZapA
MTSKGSIAGERTVQLDIHILGRDYKVACKEHERAELLDAVAFLDKRMREIREGGKTAGVDRIAVMAALNITNEMLRQREQGHGSQAELGTRIKVLRERVETALQKGQQLDL